MQTVLGARGFSLGLFPHPFRGNRRGSSRRAIVTAKEAPGAQACWCEWRVARGTFYPVASARRLLWAGRGSLTSRSPGQRTLHRASSLCPPCAPAPRGPICPEGPACLPRVLTRAEGQLGLSSPPESAHTTQTPAPGVCPMLLGGGGGGGERRGVAGSRYTARGWGGTRPGEPVAEGGAPPPRLPFFGGPPAPCYALTCCQACPCPGTGGTLSS